MPGLSQDGRLVIVSIWSCAQPVIQIGLMVGFPGIMNLMLTIMMMEKRNFLVAKELSMVKI